MKKIAAISCSVLLSLSLAACGTSGTETTDSEPAVSMGEILSQTASDTESIENAVESAIASVQSAIDNTSESIAQAASQPDNSQSTASQSGTSIRSDFKEAMDSYEAFYDSYVEFLKSYDATDLSMLSKYTELIGKAAEMDKKFQQWNSADLNDAETAYYIDVQARVAKKLLEAAS